MITLTSLKSKRGEMCEWCHAEPMTQRHHCLIHRMKGHPELDDERNIMGVGIKCHSNGIVNSRVAREWFYMQQCERYPDFREWWAKLPMKVKEQFE